MKKLSVEEVAALPVVRRGRYSMLHLEMTTLKVGEGLEVEKGTDWKGKRTPHQLVRRFSKKYGWKMSVRPLDSKKSGWRIVRES
jgi:hypothetical protein